jgi:formylglycine-generating enzyme required for sulfatase activity
VIPHSLIEACRAKSCVPFIGAGLSMQSGLPSWASIIGEMKSYLAKRASQPADELRWLESNGPLEIADRFKRKMSPAEYQQRLVSWFDPADSKIAPAHAALMETPWPFLVTTNFDRLIETAFTQTAGRMLTTSWTYEQLVKANAAGNQFLVKLHGSVEDPDSVVLTESDYARLAAKEERLLRFIGESLLTMKRVMFVGLSMSDPELRSLLLQSRIITNGYALGDYVVLTAPNSTDVEIWSERGLNVIALESHKHLALFFRELANAVQNSETRRFAEEQAVRALNDAQRSVLAMRRTLPEPLQEVSLHLESDSRGSMAELHLPKDLEELRQTTSFGAIIGEAGSGKSTLLALIAHHCIERGASVVHVDAAFLEAERISVRDAVATAGSQSAPPVVLIDGLDEVAEAARDGILSSLRDATRAGCIVFFTSRPIKIVTMDGLATFSVNPLSDESFLGLAGGPPSERSNLLRVLHQAPSLHGRPLHARALRDYLESQGGAPTSEAHYALWALRQTYAAQGIDAATTLRLEAAAATLYLSGTGIRWSLEEWAAASASSPFSGSGQEVVQAVIDLTGETALFHRTGGLLAPNHRTVFEAMVGSGIAKGDRVDTLLNMDAGLDETSSVISCVLSCLSAQEALTTMSAVVRQAPLVAVRALLSAGEENAIRDLLSDQQFEVDLRAAVRHGRSILGIDTLIDILTPIFSRKLRSPSLLADAVEVAEAITGQEDRVKPAARAHKLLKDLWDEHKSFDAGVEWSPTLSGCFVCGVDQGRDRDEEPAHSVVLSSFRIARFQITNLQYEKFFPAYVRARVSSQDKMPAVDITWGEAQLFSRWVSSNRGGRLPTEAEWEVAARGGCMTAFPWGDAFDPTRTNCGEDASSVMNVGTFPPNGYGLYDMAGNVYEWCLDWYQGDYYKICDRNNPRGPATGRTKVMRGGSWGRSVHACSCTYRVRQVPETRDVLVGFRPVLTELDIEDKR